ncbi:hypothetical protein PG984_010202 [Apiospora sp. TS-2023a]
MAMRRLVCEGLAYVLLCASVYGVFCFFPIVISIIVLAIHEPLYLFTHYEWLLLSLPGLFARPLLRQSRALVLFAAQTRRHGEDEADNHLPLRWVIEYWCDIVNMVTVLIPDLEPRLRHRKPESSPGRGCLKYLHPFGAPEPLGGLSDQEMRDSQDMLDMFHARKLRVYLPRSGDLCRLYLAKEHFDNVCEFGPVLSRLPTPILMVPLTVSYPIWRMPFWNGLRFAVLDWWWWNCIEQHFLWDLFFDLRDTTRMREMIVFNRWDPAWEARRRRPSKYVWDTGVES